MQPAKARGATADPMDEWPTRGTRGIAAKQAGLATLGLQRIEGRHVQAEVCARPDINECTVDLVVEPHEPLRPGLVWEERHDAGW